MDDGLRAGIGAAPAEDFPFTRQAAYLNAAAIGLVSALAEPAARREAEVLLARKREDDPAATSLDASEFAYYAEAVRREQFDVDAREVRRYFDFAKVQQGLLDVTGQLFGVEYRVVDVPAWHPDVVVFDVLRAAERIGRVYLDLHPRKGKFTHAGAAALRPGLAGRQLTEGALVCNFSRGLMEHDDVVTLFHEFGHLMHQVFSGERQRYARFSGEATELDFVEAPSQLLEEWAWDAKVLRSFATDAGGVPIPEDLVGRMRAAKEFGNGCFVRKQMYLAMLAYRMHAGCPDDLPALAEELQEKYDVFDRLPGTHAHTSFLHLAGYGSSYYAYMWSLVIAKDLFTGFDRADLLDPAAGARYRDHVLAPGGSADAAGLVAARTRPPPSAGGSMRLGTLPTRCPSGTDPVAPPRSAGRMHDDLLDTVEWIVGEGLRRPGEDRHLRAFQWRLCGVDRCHLHPGRLRVRDRRHGSCGPSDVHREHSGVLDHRDQADPDAGR